MTKAFYDELIFSNALQQGHFILSSGLHSDKYIQCAKLFIDPNRAEKIVRWLVEKILENISNHQIDLVVAPAMGAVILGYEVAKQLNCRSIFCERTHGQFMFRRGFTISQGEKVLLIEDVITTAKSSLETITLLKQHKAEIIAEACLIDRSKGMAAERLPFPLVSLLKMDVLTYEEHQIPDFLRNIPVTTPGSRFIQGHKK